MINRARKVLQKKKKIYVSLWKIYQLFSWKVRTVFVCFSRSHNKILQYEYLMLALVNFTEFTKVFSLFLFACLLVLFVCTLCTFLCLFQVHLIYSLNLPIKEKSNSEFCDVSYRSDWEVLNLGNVQIGWRISSSYGSKQGTTCTDRYWWGKMILWIIIPWVTECLLNTFFGGIANTFFSWIHL